METTISWVVTEVSLANPNDMWQIARIEIGKAGTDGKTHLSVIINENGEVRRLALKVKRQGTWGHVTSEKRLEIARPIAEDTARAFARAIGAEVGRCGLRLVEYDRGTLSVFRVMSAKGPDSEVGAVPQQERPADEELTPVLCLAQGAKREDAASA
jgi:hypothetical protein